MPIAAVTGRAEIMDHTGPGSLGGTFGGNPLACEAALATIRVIEQNGLNERAVTIGEQFRTRALEWRERFPFVGDVRGLGAMQAFEVVQPDGSRAPNPETTKTIVRYCYEHGVILVTAGSYNNVIRILMPLVISDEQMEEAMDVLEAALRAVSGTGVDEPVDAEVPAGAA